MDTTNINYNAQYFINRLPCGYCTLLRRACPMFPTSISPTWGIGDSVKWTPDPNVIYTETNAKEADNG